MKLKAKSSSEMDISDCSENQQQSDGNELKFQEEDVEVDLMECGNSGDEFQEKEEVLRQASSSSSFSNSMCTRDSNLNFVDEEDEAQSMLSIDYPLPDETDFCGLTKKKLTDHWRRFSNPLAWRGKWLELKVKEIESQARWYEKEVERHYETKMFDLEKVFKRGRRKRVEETIDVKAYRANHNVFSYPGFNIADKPTPVALKSQYFDLDFGQKLKAMSKESDIEDDCFVSELDCSDDDIVANVLCKIDDAQERARELKKRIDQLMWESHSEQDSKQSALVQEPLMPYTSARNQSVMLRPQIGGQCLNNKFPVSFEGLSLPTILEDVPIDGAEMNDDDEAETDEETFDYFSKLMDEITGVPPEEGDAD